MGQTNYKFRYYDCNGAFKFELTDVVSVEYSRKRNDLGICTVTLVGASYDVEDFDRDDRLEIYRFVRGQAKLAGETCWFLRKYELQIDSECDTTITLTFYDTIHLLTRRYVAWSGKSTFSYVSHMGYQKLDTMLHLLMYFNYGAGTVNPALAANSLGVLIPAGTFSATPAIASWQIEPYGTTVADLVNRQFPIDLTNVSGDSTRTTTQKFEHLSVLEAMQNVSSYSDFEGEKVYFDIIYTPATANSVAKFTFQTWIDIRGADRTYGPARYVVGPEYGNLTDATILRDWENEATVAYIAGSGEDEARLYSSASTLEQPNCTFYPIEVFGTSNTGDDAIPVHNSPDGIAAARVLLAEHSAVETLTGTIINNDSVDFFENIKPYDKVLAKFKDFEVKVYLDEYTVTIDDKGEEISIPLII